jgi:hypothetical protein
MLEKNSQVGFAFLFKQIFTSKVLYIMRKHHGRCLVKIEEQRDPGVKTRTPLLFACVVEPGKGEKAATQTQGIPGPTTTTPLVHRNQSY